MNWDEWRKTTPKPKITGRGMSRATRRAIYHARYTDKYGYKEIAEHFSISLSTAWKVANDERRRIEKQALLP